MQFEADKRAVFDMLNAIKSKAHFEKATIRWDSGITDLNAYYDQQANSAWAESFAPIIKGVVEDAAGHWTTETGVEAGTAFNVHNLEAENWFNTAALKFSTPINDTSKKEIAGLLQQGEMEGWTISKMQSTMTDLFTQWTNGTGDAATFAGERLPPYRTEMIARTVSMQSYNAGSTELYKQAGVEQQEWVATNDNRTRESHAAANGQVVDVDTPFDVGGSQLLFPGDDSLGADVGEIVNCRCTTVPVIPEGGLQTGDESAYAEPEEAVTSPINAKTPDEWTSIKDAKDFMAEMHPDLVFKWSNNADLDVTRKTIQQYEVLAQKYPDVVADMDTFRSISRSEAVKDWGTSFSKGAAAYYDPNSSMRGRGLYIIDDQLRSEMIETPGYGGWLVQDTTKAEGMVTHEFGHGVHFYLSDQYNEYFEPAFSADGFGRVSTTANNWARNTMLSDPAQLSKYGMSNEFENFAETFESYEMIPESQWSNHTQQFANMMDLVYDPDNWNQTAKPLAKIPAADQQAIIDRIDIDRAAAGL